MIGEVSCSLATNCQISRLCLGGDFLEYAVLPPVTRPLLNSGRLTPNMTARIIVERFVASCAAARA